MNDDDEQYLASNFLKENDPDQQYLASNFLKKEHKKKLGLLERAGEAAEHYINKPIEALGRTVLGNAKRNSKQVTDVAGGAAQGLLNIAPGLYNLGASGANALGANVPKSPMFDFAANSPEATLGDISSFFMGPGLIKGAAKIPEVSNAVKRAMDIPHIAKIIKESANTLSKAPKTSRIAGNAILGGAYAPDNPLLGMGLGAAGGALGEGISKGYSGVKNSILNNDFLKTNISKFKPAALAKEIEHNLSLGTNNIEKNSRLLSDDIRKAYNSRNAESVAFFDHALEKAGNDRIYQVHPAILGKLDESANTLNKIKDLNVGDLYHTFKSNPTFNNAHKLQSELFTLGNKLKNPHNTQDQLFQIDKIKAAREELNNDITRFLERRDKHSNQPLLPQYNKGRELFREHVAPYFENTKILDIVKGGKTNVKNMNTIFSSPSNIINKQGVEEIGHINKIMKDLPENAKNRILFNAIGGNKLSARALSKKLDEVKSKGFESYITPEIEQSINALNQRLKNKKRINDLGKMAGASALLYEGGKGFGNLF